MSLRDKSHSPSKGLALSYLYGGLLRGKSVDFLALCAGVDNLLAASLKADSIGKCPNLPLSFSGPR
jgi:hypothetical protein